MGSVSFCLYQKCFFLHPSLLKTEPLRKKKINTFYECNFNSLNINEM